MKKFHQYIFEIIAIFIGITLSFLFEEWREHLKESKKEAEYYWSLLRDIKSDSTYLTRINDLSNVSLQRLDSLYGSGQNLVQRQELQLLTDLICSCYFKKEPKVLLQSFEAVKFNSDFDILENERILQVSLEILDNNKRLDRMLTEEIKVQNSFDNFLSRNYSGFKTVCFERLGGSNKHIDTDRVSAFLNNPATTDVLTDLYNITYSLNWKSNQLLEQLENLRTAIIKESL